MTKRRFTDAGGANEAENGFAVHHAFGRLRLQRLRCCFYLFGAALCGGAADRSLSAMELCLARGEVELSMIELHRTRRDRLGLPLDLMPGELLPREHFRFARGDHDLTRLEVGETPEPLTLVAEARLHALLLCAQLLLARLERDLALLELGETLQLPRQLGFAKGE